MGDNNTDTYAAFRVIALEPIDAAMIEFTKRLGIDVTPELELAVKQYMREYRRLTGKVSDHEWESGPCDYAMGKALVAGIEIHVCFLYAEAEFEVNENRTDGEFYYTTKLSPDSWSVEKTSEKITF